MSSRSLVYVKANDTRYGFKVASHDPKTSKVLGLQCRFYESNNDEDVDVEDLVFGSEVELNVVMRLRLEAAVIVKSRMLALFKRIQSEANDDVNDEAQFSYSVMIPKMKTALFSLVVHYISCGASFQMASNIIGCTYNVLGDLCLCACSRQDVNKFIWVVCVINLQCIVDIL
ncbi:unnamed protein product [Sphagnum troendelagicum]